VNFDFIKHIFQNINKPLTWFTFLSFFLLLWLLTSSSNNEFSSFKNYQGWILALLLFSLCAWLIALYPSAKNYVIKIRKERKVFETIETLNNEEKFILSYCFLKKERRIYFLKDVGTVFNGLKSADLIRRTQNRGRGFPCDTYTVPEWFFEFLIRPSLRLRLSDLLNTTEISSEPSINDLWGIKDINDLELVQNTIKARYIL